MNTNHNIGLTKIQESPRGGTGLKSYSQCRESGRWIQQSSLLQVRRQVGFGLIITLALLIVAASAQASLRPPVNEEGSWVNYDQATRGVTRLDFDRKVEDITDCSNGICRRVIGGKTLYFIHLFGKCHPTDCDWGEVEGARMTGNLEGWYHFVYDHGFAKRYVYVRTYEQWPGWLRFWMYTDFADPSRDDYTIDDWFRRP